MLESIVALAAYPQLLIYVFIVLIIYKAHKASDCAFNVFDYFLDPVTHKASITRTGQMLAIITSTWFIAKMALLGTLTPELFALYLAAMGLSEGFGKWVAAKYSKETPAAPQEQQING